MHRKDAADQIVQAFFALLCAPSHCEPDSQPKPHRFNRKRVVCQRQLVLADAGQN